MYYHTLKITFLCRNSWAIFTVHLKIDISLEEMMALWQPCGHPSWNAGRGHTLMKSLAAAKSLQSCLTLCDPIDGSPSGSLVPGILQARTLEWVAISFSNAWALVCLKRLSRGGSLCFVFNQFLFAHLLRMRSILGGTHQSFPLLPCLQRPVFILTVNFSPCLRNQANMSSSRPWYSAGKESACNAGDPGSILGSGRSSGEGNSYSLQYFWASPVAQQ